MKKLILITLLLMFHIETLATEEQKVSIADVLNFAIEKQEAITRPSMADDEAQQYDGPLFATNAISGKWDFLYPDGFLSNSKTNEPATTPQSTK